MITCEMFKGQESWSSPPDQRRASALRTAGRFIGLLWAGGGSKKKKVPIGRARLRLGFAIWVELSGVRIFANDFNGLSGWWRIGHMQDVPIP
jgi:hypothetical protein